MAWLCCSLAALPAAAQEEDIDLEFELLEEEDIVYSAAKHEQDIAESPSAITVITREQIENTHCTDIVCLLRMVPEVDVRILMPSYAVVGARSLTDGYIGDKALLILDGREINFEFMGIPLWMELPFSIEDVERIEVIRGPGSALYGPNAHSMVVTVTTRKKTHRTAEIFLGTGENDRSQLSLRVGQKFGDFHFMVSASRDAAGDWRIQDKQDREINRVRLRIDYQGESSSTSLDLLFWSAAGEILTAIAPGEIPKSLLGHVFLTHTMDFLKAQVSLGVADADFHIDLPLYYGQAKMGEFPELLDILSLNLDTELQVNWSAFEGNLLIGGVSYRWFTTESQANHPTETNEHRLGVFVHVEQRLFGDLILTGSARLDYNTITPLAFNPRLAAVWRFTPNQLVRAAFGRAFRKPSTFNTSTHIKNVKGEPGFEGLGDFFQNNVGNPDLGNESITSLEAGYRGYFLDSSLVAEADVFYNLYRDTINFYVNIATDQFGIPDLDNSSMHFSNQGQNVDSLGGSVSLTYRIKETLRLNANYTYRYSFYITDPEEATEPGKKGDRVRWEPEHLLNISFHYLTRMGLNFGVSAHAHSANELAVPESGGIFDDVVLVPSPARYFLNGFLSWRVPLGDHWIEAGARAYNVLHTGFRDTAAVFRDDGALFGGQLLGRRIFVFLRGSI